MSRLLALAGLALAFAAGAADTPRMSPDALAARLAENDAQVFVLDVRSEEEYAAGHVPGAVNLPHVAIAGRLGELEAARDKDVVVYCRSGRRADLAIEALAQAGFRRLHHLDGDFQRWSEEARPIATPDPAD